MAGEPADDRPDGRSAAAAGAARGAPTDAGADGAATDAGADGAATDAGADGAATDKRAAWREVFAAFLRLGLTSFGGPVAHLGYFRAEFVQRRRWLDEPAYGDLVALCQFLPGPASSQVGMALGLMRAGWRGMLAAWVGFTLPSAVAMVLAAEGFAELDDPAQAGWVHGLKLVAVAVVAQAVWGMARSLCPDRARASVAVAGCLLVLAWPGPVGQIGALCLGGLAGVLVLPRQAASGEASALPVVLDRRAAVVALAVFALLLAATPLADAGGQAVRLAAAFYRTGALVFGGGHVVLPLLQQAVVPPGWVANGTFLAGYGVAQAIPGPLFTFAAYLGAVEAPAPHGWLGGLLATVAIFLPSFLLVAGSLAFWDGLRRRRGVQAALRGVNAAVVGVLLAALFTPVWTDAVTSPMAFAGALLAFLLLAGWGVPAWVVVIGGAVAGL
jgi:chromate transporter